MRIGERLLEAGLITVEQLENALQGQVVQGGRLGTNLVEREYLNLDQLSEHLAVQRGSRAALSKHFDRCDPWVQERLSPEIAAKWQVIPMGQVAEQELIAVASTDPLPEEALAELRQVYGMEILPSLAPELRILYNLEFVYGIERLSRFRRTRRRDSVPPPAGATGTGRERRQFVRTLTDSEKLEAPNSLARVAVRQIFVSREDMVDIATKTKTVESTQAQIRRANDRDQIGDLIVSALKNAFDDAFNAAVIFIVREDLAIGWKGFTRSTDSEAIDAIAVPLDAESLLRTAFEARAPHRSSPDDAGSKLDARLWDALGGQPPAGVIVHPIVLEKHIVCLVYAQTTETVSDSLDKGFAALCETFARAMARLIRSAQR